MNCYERAYYAAKALDVYLPGAGPIKLIFAVPPGQDKAGVEAGETMPQPYASNALHWSKSTFLAIYTTRTSTDNGYRDEKQNMGLHEYQMRKGNGILKDAELVFTVHRMLLLINANRPLRQRLQTVGEICRWLKTLRDRENAKWIYEKAAAGEPLPDILEALGLA